MNDTSNATPTRTKNLPWLVAAMAYVLLMALAPKLLNDPDTYSHIAIGNWIWAHGAVPTTDAFSFSMPGGEWISFAWLSQLIYAAAYSAFGWIGVAALASASIALTLGLLTHFLLRELSPKFTLLFVAATFVLLAPHLLARPHVLALPVMLCWAAALVRCMDHRAPPPYWALLLIVLWVNLHGSVVLGLGLIGPVVLEAFIESRRSEWLGIVKRWLPFTLLAIFASCLTPYGSGSLLVPLTTYSAGDALNYIAEWRPQNFGKVAPFELLLLGGIFVLSRGVTLPVVRTLVVLGLLHLALSQVRHADLLAILAPLYLAAPIARQFGENAEARAAIPMWTRWVAIGAIACITGLATMRDLRPATQITPDAAIKAAGLTASNRIFNDYSFGGYLVFGGIPTFIDGRSELFGGEFLARYNKALSLDELNDFIKLLDEYRIDATLLEPGTPAVALLDRLPEWKRVYGDGVAIVHKRINPPKT